MKKFAVIVAGGSGSRMNNNIPKQFLNLQGKPVLFYTLKTFLQAYEDLTIILVLPEEHIRVGQAVIDAYFDYTRIQIAIGGPTRFHSVQNGLKLISEESIVFVHDAVRCMASVGLVRRCYEEALEKGSAIPVIGCKDSIRWISETGNEALERENIKMVQTPQTFHSKLILPAYRIDFKDKFTDESSVIEAYGLTVHLIPGEENNIKITRPVDLIIAEYLLSTN